MCALRYILLALTPPERWAAARRFDAASASDSWFILAACAVLLVLAVLLIWISLRRWTQARVRRQEQFAQLALQRGLTTRERQLLLAIAVRSDLLHAHDVYSGPDAFSQGAGKLLTECMRARTPQDYDQMEGEIGRLREKLGFQVNLDGQGRPVSTRTSTRSIPVGRSIELTPRKDAEGLSVLAEVVDNEEAGLTVETREALGAHAGDPWRARHCYGMSAWEFDTSTVSCTGRTLVLSHTDRLHFVNRRRFVRVNVRVPALVARIPFMRGDCEGAEEEREKVDTLARMAPRFVSSVVTELAGPGLRIETPLHVRSNERVLVLFRLYESGEEGSGESRRTITAVGQVKHCRSTDRIVAMAVELVGLLDGEIDELARVTDALAHRRDRVGRGVVDNSGARSTAGVT